MAQEKKLTEQIDILEESKLVEDQRSIQPVRVIKAGRSLNGNFYPPDVLERAAPLFNESKAYADHAMWGDPSVVQTTGWYLNARYQNNALYADRYFTRNSVAEDIYLIASDIVKGVAPKSLAGLSINIMAKGDYVADELSGIDVFRVSEITEVFSVDDVAYPAAQGAYTEADKRMRQALLEEMLKEMDFEQWRGINPKFIHRLRKELATVRQTEAVKTLTEQVAALQEQLTAEQRRAKPVIESEQKVRQEVEAANKKARSLERLLKIERLLRDAELPAAFEEDLRARLPKLAEDQWAGAIAQEQRKVDQSEIESRIPAEGSVTETRQRQPIVIGNDHKEGLDMDQFKSPDEFRKFLESVSWG